jgi:uncharacterized protein YhfF
MASQLRTILVADPQEINRIANFSSQVGASVSSIYCPVLTSEGELIVFQDGEPILKYRPSADSKGAIRQVNHSSTREEIEECIDFLRKEKERHIAGVFLDDEKDARHVEFDFLLNGLKRGTTCIYVLPEEDPEPSEKIRREMKDHIDLRGASTALLERFGVYKVPDPADHPLGLDQGVKETTEKLLQQAGPPPYTIVGHYTPRWNTKESIECNIRIEEIFHTAFPKLNGSTLCSYHSASNDIDLGRYWRDGLLKNHHLAIVLEPQRVGVLTQYGLSKGGDF